MSRFDLPPVLLNRSEPEYQPFYSDVRLSVVTDAFAIRTKPVIISFLMNVERVCSCYLLPGLFPIFPMERL